jgi:hypothetical protein
MALALSVPFREFRGFQILPAPPALFVWFVDESPGSQRRLAGDHMAAQPGSPGQAG